MNPFFFKKAAAWLARPALLFYALPWLMILLTAGTLAQGPMGLYAAQEMFFSSFILWLGPVPLPGAYMTIGAILISLLAKILRDSPWSAGKSGILIAHIGVALLLFGGIVTGLTSREGVIVLAEGESGSAFSSYHDRELRIEKNGAPFLRLPSARIREGLTIARKDLPFSLTILEHCRNCTPEAAEESAGRQGLAAKMSLEAAAPLAQDEMNQSGVTFALQGAGAEYDGIWISLEDLPHQPVVKANGNEYRIELGRVTYELPFALMLKDFTREMHPGTMTARAFSSDVTVTDEGIEWPATIRMNEPLRYKGYTFYQSSFEDGGEREVSVLSVVQNKGRLFPYVASAVIFAGLLLHLGLRLSGRMGLAVLALLLVSPFPAQAKEMDYGAFAQIPVLHEGRVKPLDSFARIHLKSFSGRESLDGESAPAWLAQVLFDPAGAVERGVFKIPQHAELGLSPKNGLYTYAELAAALRGKAPVITSLLEQDESQWSPAQRRLIAWHEYSILYTQMLRTFSMSLPLAIPLPPALQKEWGMERDDYTLEDFRSRARGLQARVEGIVARKGPDPQNYSEEEREIVAFAYALQLLEDPGAGNVLLRIIPPQWSGAGEDWFSPWALEQSGQGSPDSAAYIEIWKDMASAWRAGDTARWEAASAQALETVSAMQGAGGHVFRNRIEGVYNAAHPMILAMAAYFGAVLLLIGATFGPQRPLQAAALGLLIAGTIAHTAGMIARIIILERPPVGTLYESILFVALVCVAAALALEARQKDSTGTLAGSLAGAALLAVATAFAGDDTLKMLVAVLNTNFWLATHVLCITIGYGWCLIAAILSHLYLIQRTRQNRKASEKLLRSTRIVALAALLFTAVGTILGGIWADQSWGRFWGWDPKENGALLIALWLIWLLHGQIGGQIRILPFMAGMAFLSVIVALAWFGVNLLSVGLHSYGFIDGVAWALAGFCAAEGAIIGGLWFAIRRKEAPV